MGFFDLFKKKAENKVPKGFEEASMKIKRLTDKAVEVVIIPTDSSQQFSFSPGQYVNVLVNVNGEECRRSYSLCSSPKEGLAIGVKAIPNGKVSNWFNSTAKDGDLIYFSKPEGSFIVPSTAKKLVGIVAGSGITPLLSIAKSKVADVEMSLIYGNKTPKDVMFAEELNSIQNLKIQHFYSQAEVEGAKAGRIEESSLMEFIKTDLTILKSDLFLLCGPEALVFSAKKTLNFFGVSDDKIKFELFTAPTLFVKEEKAESNFKGTSKVKVILDQEVNTMEIQVPGPTILESVDKAGLDAPFSCRGGVCSSCRAKVLDGKASMRVNYSLTDEEVKKGYILTCQAHPETPELTVSFDE